MPSPKIILLLTLSVLTILAHSQETPSPPTVDTTKAEGRIFEKVEIEAEFPGGVDAWRKFLEQNLNPNVPVDNGAPSGMYNVFVEFIVARDGTLADIKPLTKLGYGMEQEVIRIIKKSGTWKPAIQSGKAVNAWRKQPVTFMVTADGYTISSKVPYVLFTDTDNEITVEVEKVKTGDVQLIMPGGTITPAGDGKYIVRLNGPGKRRIIEIYNTKKKKSIGSVSFEVRDGKSK